MNIFKAAWEKVKSALGFSSSSKPTQKKQQIVTDFGEFRTKKVTGRVHGSAAHCQRPEARAYVDKLIAAGAIKPDPKPDVKPAVVAKVKR